MSTSYWAQFSRADVSSMHGVEDYDYQHHDEDNYDTDSEEEQQCCSSCMNCLCLSWRDFM